LDGFFGYAQDNHPNNPKECRELYAAVASNYDIIESCTLQSMHKEELLTKLKELSYDYNQKKQK
jgi:hypothetical protein